MTRSESLRIEETQVDYRRLVWVGPLAIVLAVVGNIVVYTLAAALGAFPADLIIPAAGQPLTIAPVIFTTIVGVVGGIAMYALLGRLVRRPVRLFRIIGIVVLALSFVTPFSIPGGTPLFYTALLAMHVVAALVCLVLLTTMARTA